MEKPPAPPAAPQPANKKQTKKKRLSSALRENIKRRKAAPRPPKPAGEKGG